MHNITVIVPTSPIKSHPDTSIIDECIASIRNQLPDSEILLQIDGVHPDQTHFEEQYFEYKERILWKCLHEWSNVTPYLMSEHEHQSGMMHETINEIYTDYILYVEGDTMLNDRHIDWVKCMNFIEQGNANTIRFHFEEVIPEAHKDLIIGEPKNNFLKTFQWSQRPHLSSRVYYKDMIKHFPRHAKSFIEDYWHGVVMQDYYENGLLGWNKHGLWIYHEKDKLGIKRSYTVDGRQGEAKVGEGFQS